ncbi:MAG: DNA polymerase Y family protein [Sphingobacteriales bacterium]|nr:MAG: DNA polymerase Y family protein [Sphingobacteriales bacterium]
MEKRYMTIWFRYLLANRMTLRKPELKDKSFVFKSTVANRVVVSACNNNAQKQGIFIGMPLADAMAILPDLEVFQEIPKQNERLLKALGKWCIRYTPIVAVDLPCGLIFDISGCTHLWGGEAGYYKEIINRLRNLGYDVRGAIADTIGAARAVAHYGIISPIVKSKKQHEALLPLPPAALQLENITLQKLNKLGLNTINSFISMPRSVLRRRFGENMLQQIARALGDEEEHIKPIQVPQPYEQRLPSIEPIRTATGIEIAIKNLLELLCKQLSNDGMGLRAASLNCYRVDGKIISVNIGTNMPNSNPSHLFKLFELKIASIAPALGIELFIMEATKVEELNPVQEILWQKEGGLDEICLAELLDRLAGKLGNSVIHRYLPQARYWPERSIKAVNSFSEKLEIGWMNDRPRPVQLLNKPEAIEVTAPIPDYPPMLFRYKEQTHKIKKADGPERIEREWWLDEGQHRDYYTVEDESGKRYWLFRSGHYNGEKPSGWFIHGFFA